MQELDLLSGFSLPEVEKSHQPFVDVAQALLFCELLGKKEEETHVRAFPHKKSKRRDQLKARSGKILPMISTN